MTKSRSRLRKRFPRLVETAAKSPCAAAPGAFADLIDESYGVDDAAAAAGTIGYEILTSIGRRALRIYRGGIG